jgi:DNA-binding NtrC family response regulator
MNQIGSQEIDTHAARSALVVSAVMDDVAFALSALSAGGFTVTIASSFEKARTLIAAKAPTVLITDLRLGQYNGLKLVLHARRTHPALAAVVISGWADFPLQLDAEALGVTFALSPTTREEFSAAVFRTIGRRLGDPPIRPPFERRGRARRQREPTVASESERRGQTERRRMVQIRG